MKFLNMSEKITLIKKKIRLNTNKLIDIELLFLKMLESD